MNKVHFDYAATMLVVPEVASVMSNCLTYKSLAKSASGLDS